MSDVDHDYIDEHGLVERYVKRRLEPQLEQAFEIHLLDCPRCIDAIETAEFLEAGLRDGLAADPPAAVPPRRARPLTWLADATRSTGSSRLHLPVCFSVISS